MKAENVKLTQRNHLNQMKKIFLAIVIGLWYNTASAYELVEVKDPDGKLPSVVCVRSNFLDASGLSCDWSGYQ